ncbi:DNA methyltransferase [bacterium]|jgi:DNA modification methylase|nr:DNA methyltransferase [bacterium]
MTLAKKHIDNTWDFRTANTKEYTHCYHNYPAMMIPQIASRLITEYGRGAKTLFDPYCGTGTSLVEANINGIDAYGTDLNPMAQLIAKAKTSKIELQILDLYLKEFNDYLFALNFGIKKLNIIVPTFKNIDFWFKEETKNTLAIIKQFIDNIKDKKVQRFFLVAFSETIRESSLTRNSEFKLYRMSEKQRENFNPDVFGMINLKLVRNRIGLKNYIKKNQNSVNAHIYNFNSSENMNEIQKKSIDIVVTSPPYGDSRTTVAYGQFSRLSNQWLGVEDASQIDNQLMGGRTKTIKETGIDIIDKTIEIINKKDSKRAKEVYSFYSDYSKSIANVSTVIKHNGYACYVVGNRRVKDTTLPTDEITKCLFEKYGFKYKNTFIRNIPNKRMPSKNSPTNKIGKTATTMNNEYIVIMQKQ